MGEERSRIVRHAAEPVAFARRLAGSESFKAMFREGMTLVEETAAYLDGDGKREARRLPRAASLSYATESMRLTTRLMQLASWLLLQRAVNDGDMSMDQANHERAKVRLGGLSSATDGLSWESLPERLQGLINRSLALQHRIIRLDNAIRGPAASPVADNPVAREIGRIAAAFGALS
jgi:regulator of CtrA degradation